MKLFRRKKATKQAKEGIITDDGCGVVLKDLEAWENKTIIVKEPSNEKASEDDISTDEASMSSQEAASSSNVSIKKEDETKGSMPKQETPSADDKTSDDKTQLEQAKPEESSLKPQQPSAESSKSMPSDSAMPHESESSPETSKNSDAIGQSEESPKEVKVQPKLTVTTAPTVEEINGAIEKPDSAEGSIPKSKGIEKAIKLETSPEDVTSKSPSTIKTNKEVVKKAVDKAESTACDDSSKSSNANIELSSPTSQSKTNKIMKFLRKGGSKENKAPVVSSSSTAKPDLLNTTAETIYSSESSSHTENNENIIAVKKVQSQQATSSHLKKEQDSKPVMEITTLNLSKLIKQKNSVKKKSPPPVFMPRNPNRPRPASMSMSKRNEEQFRKYVERQKMGRNARARIHRAL